MKKFNEFSEALLVTLHPKSDSVGPVEPCGCPQQDMMSAAAEDVLKNLGGDVIQPDDGIGDYGENQADGIGDYADGIGDYAEDAEGVELECTGDGLRVKFNGVEIVLPKNVVEKIKGHIEHEETETPEEEEAEHEETESEDEDTETEETVEEPEEEEEEEQEEEEVEESKNWIQKAVNPKHEGFCTPMTKKTCTPKRKALAKRFKKGIED